MKPTKRTILSTSSNAAVTGDLTADARFRLLVEEVTEYAIFLLDLNGNVISWNAGAQRLKGYRSEEIIGKNFSSFYGEGDRKAGKPERALATARAEERFMDEGWRYRKDGSRFWASVVVTALTDKGGHLVGYSKITRDLTDRRMAEEALRQARADLEVRVEERTRELLRINAELEQFAFVASHDLQEPLRKVANNCDLLVRRLGESMDADARLNVRRIVTSVDRMRSLINDLLQFSRATKQSPAREVVDVREQVRLAIEDLPEAAGADIVVGDMPLIHANPIQIRQVFQNLIGNAIKFRGPREPKIRVLSEKTVDGHLFVVQDNGIGIEPDYRERIFVLFQRLHTQDRYPGTGIGLAVCKKIIESCGGRIWVEPNPGGGSRFVFTWPESGPPPAQD